MLIDSIAFDAWPSPQEPSSSNRVWATRTPRSSGRGSTASSTPGWGTADASPTSILTSTAARSTATTACNASRGSPRTFDGEGLIGWKPARPSSRIPAFVLWGEDDAFLPAELAERLGDALPWASVALLPGCGHFLLEDAAETVAPLIAQWLRTQYLRLPQAHAHDEGRVTVELGRRPPEDGRW